MTQAQLNLLRRMAVQAQQADMDMGVGANVVLALLDEIERLRAALSQAEQRHGMGCECASCQHAAWWDS